MTALFFYLFFAYVRIILLKTSFFTFILQIFACFLQTAALLYNFFMYILQNPGRVDTGKLVKYILLNSVII